MPTAVITGATQGLGRALAAALADRGWSLVLTARSDGALAELVEVLERVGGPRSRSGGLTVRGVAGDVGDPAHRRELEQVVRAVTGPEGLDLLVNNASTLGPTPLRDLRAITADDLSAILAVNVVAPHDLTRALLTAVETAGGVVLNISSDAGVEHYETWGGYGASKAALDHLTLTLGAENPAIRAYAVDPGDMRTAMHQAAFPGDDISDRPLPDEVAVPGILALLRTRPPSGRYRAADLDVAGTAVAEVAPGGVAS